MNVCHSPIRSRHRLNPAIITFEDFAVFVYTPTFTTPSPQSYTSSLTTVILCTMVFRNIK